MIPSLESAGVEVVFVDALTEQRDSLDPSLRIQDNTLLVRDGDRWEALARDVRAGTRVHADARSVALWNLDAPDGRVLRVFDRRARRAVELPPWAAQVIEVSLTDGLLIVAVDEVRAAEVIAWDLEARAERWRRATDRGLLLEASDDRVLVYEPDQRSIRLLDAREGVALLSLRDVRRYDGWFGDAIFAQRRARGLDVIAAREARALGMLSSPARSMSPLGMIGDRALLRCDEVLQLVQLRPFAVIAGARLEPVELGPANIAIAGPSRVEIEDPTRARTLAPLDVKQAVEWLPFDERAERPARALVSREEIDSLPAPPVRDPARVAAILAVAAEEGARLSAVFERCVARGLLDAAFDPRVHEPLSRMAGGGMFRWKDGADDILRAFSTLLCDAAPITAARALLREARQRARALGEERRAEIEWRLFEPRAREPWWLRPVPCEALLFDAIPTALSSQDAKSSHGRARLLDALWQHAVERELCFAASASPSLRGRPVREFASPFAPLVALETLGYSLWCCAPRWVVSVPLIEPWSAVNPQST